MKKRYAFQICVTIICLCIERYVIAVPITWLLLSWYFHTEKFSLLWTLGFSVLSDLFLQLPFGSSACIIALIDMLLPFSTGSLIASVAWKGSIGIGIGIAYSLIHGSFSVPHIFMAGVLCILVYSMGLSAVRVEEIGNASL